MDNSQKTVDKVIHRPLWITLGLREESARGAQVVDPHGDSRPDGSCGSCGGSNGFSGVCKRNGIVMPSEML